MSSAIGQGWLKTTDPRTGRAYYVNRLTRVTQWEPPIGWNDTPASYEDGYGGFNNQNLNRNGHGHGHVRISQRSIDQDSSPTLPKNWEMVHDHKTGRHFYVDHENKTTSWEPPSDFSNLVSNPSSNTTNMNNYNNYGANTESNDIYHMSSHERLSQRNTSSSGYSIKSDTISKLEFSVVSIKDEARASCPSCQVVFSIPLKRRHHCRLCGDVFCDACTYNRCLLPLDGIEFEKPVRVCELCFSDIQRGNYFSMRRYLATLQLFDPNHAVSAITDPNDPAGQNNQGTGISETQVCAALASLRSDLDGVLMDATSFEEKICIPAETLVPAITRHLDYSGTSDRAICALSPLLALGKIVGDNSFAIAIYRQDEPVIDSILKLLEQSGSSRHTLFFQEQAARAIFYLSDPDLLSKVSPEDQTLDLHRALRNMLDHATCSDSPSLQRWAAACTRNLIIQDQCRTSLYAKTDTKYESFTTQLVETGGVIILCSLIAAEDGDTRAHALSALSAVICAARDLNQNNLDADMVNAISNSGGCGEAISQLLLSSDVSVVRMSVSFASHLVAPLLGYHRVPMFSASASSSDSNTKFLNSYCEAALALVIEGDCLPALVQLISPSSSYNSKSSTLELQVSAMETLSAIAIACNSHSDTSSSKVKEVATKLLAIPALPTAFEILSSMSSQSLNAERDSPQSQLREAAGLFIGQILLLDESNEALNYLCANKAAIVFFTLAGDDGMFQPSAVQGEWAPRCLSWIEAAAFLLSKVWYKGQSLLCKEPISTQGSVNSNTSKTGFSTETLDYLLEVIDAGAVQILSQILSRNLDVNTQGDYYLKIAACHNVAAMFGIAHGDDTNIAATRLYDAIQSSDYSAGRSGRGNDLISLTLSFMQSVSHQVQKYNGEENYMPLHALVEASLMATGSVCGTFIGCKTRNNLFLDLDGPPINFTELAVKDNYLAMKQKTCNNAAKILFSGSTPIPSMLVGLCGEGSVSPALRLTLTIAMYGAVEVRPKLAPSLIPVCDLLRQALVDGDRNEFTSTTALLRFCGPYVSAESGAKRELLNALRLVVKTLASVLAVSENGYDVGQIDTLHYLKENCIFTFEALSLNQALWTCIAHNVFIPIGEFLSDNHEWDEEDIHRRKLLCAALTTIRNVIVLPSHAVAACRAGLAVCLARLISGKKDTEIEIDKRTREGRRRALQKEKDRRQNKIEYDVKALSMELLHTLASNKEARTSGNSLINGDSIRAVCFALGGSVETSDNSNQSDSVTKWGLEILHFMISELHNTAMGGKNRLEWSEECKLFVNQIARQFRFIRALCATMLSWTDSGYTIPSLSGLHTSKNSNDGNETFEIAPLYGPPLKMYDAPCAGFSNSTEAAVAILFLIASLCSSAEANFSEAFWDTFLMREDRALVNEESKTNTSLTACSVFLCVLMDEDEGLCVPKNQNDRQFYFDHSLPIVRERLLYGLQSNLVNTFNLDMRSSAEDDASLLTVLKKFHVPSICMTLCGTTPSLIEPAFHLIQGMTSSLPDEILPHIVGDETSLRAALNMLNYQSDDYENELAVQIRLLFAKIICITATKEILGPSLEKFHLRSRAIASLSAACKNGTEEIPHFCLKSLASVFCSPKGSLQLNPKEARAIAKTIGANISSMVLDRFAKRATDHGNNDSTTDHYLMDKDPEVVLLCSLASYKEALSELCNVGGLEAICLVSSDGVPSAILAMHEVVKDDPSVILDIEGHVSVMDVLNAEFMDNISSEQGFDLIKRFRKTKVSFEFLTALCKSSEIGRTTISNAISCPPCIETATKIVCSWTSVSSGGDLDSIDVSLFNGESSSKSPTRSESVEPHKKTATISAILFLSELAHVKSSREIILRNSHLLQYLVYLGRECSDIDIIVHSTELLASLAPHVVFGKVDVMFPSSFFASIFCDLLGRSDLLKNTATKKSKPSLRDNSEVHMLLNANNNLIFARAVSGLECVFDEIEMKEKQKLYHNICHHMEKLNEEFSKGAFLKQRPSGKMISKNSGLLILNISTLLFMWNSAEANYISLIKPNFLQGLFETIILHSILEKRLGGDQAIAEYSVLADEMCFITAARTQMLQFISGIMRNNFTQNTLKISWMDLIISVKNRLDQKKMDSLNQISFSREEKFNNSCNFIDVLDSICQDKSDKVATVHALKIKKKLEYLS